MYTIYLDDALFYDPRFDEYALEIPTLTQEANMIGTLHFTIYPNHPKYGAITKIVSVLTVYKDNKPVFSGRPMYTKRAFRGGITYQCEEVTARLNDFQFRPGEYTGTIDGFMNAVLASYNSRADSGHQILLGSVKAPGGEFSYTNEDYTGHWDVLQNAVIDTAGGYIVPRYENNLVYLDYLTDEDLPEASQKITFGENMTDLFIETLSDSTYSVLVPLGADYEEGEGDETVTKPLTVESVNGGLDYIESAEGIALYGRRETVMRWDDIEDADALLAKGREYLDSIAVKFEETVDLSAIDLHNADANVESFQWMEKVQVESSVHGLSEKYVLSRISIPLDSPKSANIKLGETKRTLTDRLNNGQKTVQNAQGAILALGTDLPQIRASIAAQGQAIKEIAGTTDESILIIYTPQGETSELQVNPNWILRVGEYDVESTLRQLINRVNNLGG